MADRVGQQMLTTAAVATASSYSAQQVRDLEAAGVIAPAARAANGYRKFGTAHVRELGAYRDLATAVGPVEARRVMCQVRLVPRDEAVALVSSLHTRLAQDRADALAARDALRAIGTERHTDASPVPEDSMTIRELADALRVRASTLRFWEKSGLVSPDRVRTASGTARRYPLPAVREARIAAALRAAGYRIPEVRAAIVALRDYRDVDRPLEALEARLRLISRQGLALLRAGGVLAQIIDDGGDRLP